MVDVSVVIQSSSRHWQSCAVNVAGWASRRVTKLFEVCFADVDIAGSSVVVVVGFGWNKFNVWHLWDDQHLLGQIGRNINQVRLPRRSTDTLQQSMVVSLLIWDSSRRLRNVAPSLVHDNALDCCHSNTNKHACKPYRFQLMPSAISVVDTLAKTRHLNSPGLPFQSHASCVAIVWLTLVGEQKQIGVMLQPGQQRTSRFQQGVSKLLLQEVFEGFASPCADWTARSTSPLVFLSPLGDASGTISPCQPFSTASQRTTMVGS